ncbi:MAG: hypothetical protein WAN57_05525 [Smithella sp.]
MEKGLKVKSWLYRLILILREYTDTHPQRPKEVEQVEDKGPPLRAYMTIRDHIHEDLAFMLIRRSDLKDYEQTSIYGAFLATLAIHDLTGKYPLAATPEIIEACELLRKDGEGLEGLSELY